MKLMRGSPSASMLFSVVLGVSLLASSASSQSSSAAGLPNLSTATNGAGSASTTVASSTGSSSRSGSTSNAASGSTSGSASGSTSQTAVVITGSSSATGSQSVPAITGSATATSGGGLTGLPKLPGQFSYPPASVPPTANAPFMQSTNLPEGTVFIAVGAVLGFLAFGVLLWRGLIAWSLHRSVKRAARQDMTDTKALFRTPAAPMYKYSDRESTISLSNIGGKGGKKARPSTAGPLPANAHSLFFSPTAGAGVSAGLANPANRGSSYLPAGYYASGNAAPGNGAGLAHIGSGPGPITSISMSNLGAHAQGYSRARSVGPTPPDSPSAHATLGQHVDLSSSTLDLNRNPNGRAPSAYLDDLFDEAGTVPGQNPGHYPGPLGGRI